MGIIPFPAEEHVDHSGIVTDGTCRKEEVNSHRNHSSNACVCINDAPRLVNSGVIWASKYSTRVKTNCRNKPANHQRVSVTAKDSKYNDEHGGK